MDSQSGLLMTPKAVFAFISRCTQIAWIALALAGESLGGWQWLRGNYRQRPRSNPTWEPQRAANRRHADKLAGSLVDVDL